VGSATVLIANNDAVIFNNASANVMPICACPWLSLSQAWACLQNLVYETAFCCLSANEMKWLQVNNPNKMLY
jgi:hypothetical protein